ncbi:cobyrinate a,c-diamide synthase [Desulfatitalea alkaliphila]|uniref:Cobyrinate a,c-diamide synthase n=1 Tax=Desulfatitalea alkaliphila TaxID=2929485 RepID=A0AA41QZF1_9BACT|nr:cobyrinate a,c-diamide synthase [Desulfatitalea alkaliphila]MCJ8499937.1 cobyrinate a,c-diamide synthase [Desulfatitalea alkaliphila]
MSVHVPRLLVAGAQSGSGKTSLTLALVAALVRRGLKVQTFKVGPDFLDPTYLAIASGRPCYNLDGWMCGRAYVAALFARAAADADIAVIEGVMGLFDGARPDGPDGSTAQIACWLRAPVLLAVNVHGMARSIAALVAGYAGFEKGVAIGGVIANFCGSAGHADILRQALVAACQPALLGALPRNGLPEIPRRHLGLVSADPQTNCDTALLDRFADAAEAHMDMAGIIAMAAGAAPLTPATDPFHRTVSDAHPCLAVARDAAFHFYYPDLLEILESRGCAIRYFSPLLDHQVPVDADALYIGGGYPELYADQLAANGAMLESIRAFAGAGRPVYAECGGLIYLSRSLETLDGRRHRLAAVLPADTRMRRRKRHLGYVNVTLRRDTLWGKAGDTLRGHAFHYSELLNDPAEAPGWHHAYHLTGRSNPSGWLEGYGRGNVLASYVHLHWGGSDGVVERFVDSLKFKV